jgi:hypothetical protein
MTFKAFLSNKPSPYMHYKTIALLLTVACSSWSFAQSSFNWEASSQVDTTVEPNNYTELKLNLVNVSGSELELGIRVLYNALPSAWDGMVCVHGQCLGFIPPAGDSANMAPLDDQQTGYVRLTINPFNSNESGTLKILVYDKNNPSDRDTAIWVINQQLMSVLTPQTDLMIYPNPVVDQLWLQSSSGQPITSITVWNLLGQQLIHQTQDVATDRIQLDLSALEPGQYVVQAILPSGHRINRRICKN